MEKVTLKKDPKDAREDVVESYHGQVLETGSDEDNDVTLEDWHVGKLKFRKKHIDDQYRILGGDGRRVDDYEMTDARKKDPMSLISNSTKSGVLRKS